MLEIPITALLHAVLVTFMSLRLLFRKLAVNTTLAWMIVISAIPIFGIIIYFLFGDHRLGRKRLKLGERIRKYYQSAYDTNCEESLSRELNVSPFFDDLSKIVSKETGFHPSMGNEIRVFDEAGHTISALIEDIDSAKHQCFLEFYIVEAKGRIIGVMEALERAANRGVDCRLLVDDIGSRNFLNSDWSERLASAGVQVERSLKVGVLKSFSKRTDLRNHRKLIIIDQFIGYIGSFNLVDPVIFKRHAQVGQWVDIMARVEGHIVSSMSVVFNTDFIFDKVGGDYTQANLKEFSRTVTPRKSDTGAVLQLIPSGPEMRTSLIYEVIVAALFGSRETITIVTPYFVPDEAIVLALTNAARRGVSVTLVLPEQLDSIMARHASEAIYDNLLEAGIIIKRYQSGLLHTKAILIDKTVSFIGTVNMDMRSFYLNLEVTMAVYDAEFSRRLQSSVDHYIARSEKLEKADWDKRSKLKRFKESVFRLAAPLL